ncbi:MAG: NAD(P)/FAD-dependent oxidoreductase [Desulfobacteraceae bacterium]|jgi:dihydrolipoamide dehydrogenase
MSDLIYDVLVLGGGAGGIPAAIRAAQLGGRVAIVEAGDLGGLCMNRGCIPFCHMAEVSKIQGSLALGKEMGLDVSGVSLDYAAFKRRQDELIGFMREGTKGMLNKNKVRIIRGRGKFVARGKVEVEGEEISYKNLVLATGAKWLKPDIPGIDLEDVITTDDLLESKALPKRILLFGTSPWLLEIAQFLHHFGSKVILATEGKSILSAENKTIRTRLAKVLRNQGIEIMPKTQILDMSKQKDGLHVLLKGKDKEDTVVVDRVVALKRGAALDGLGLSAVGLSGEGEYIKINDRMQTAVDNIYAIGDITGPEERHYSHAASTGGVIAAENAMGLQERHFDPRTVARVLFTQPQVACVGLTEKEAKKAGYEVMVGAAPLSMNPSGMILSQIVGLVEVVSEKKYGEILGVHMVGDGAVEMIGQGILAIHMELTLEELARATFPHPTLSESLPEAARQAMGSAIYLP